MLNIRIACEADLDQICCLSDEINADHYANMPRFFLKPQGTMRDRAFWRGFIDREQAMIYVAEQDSLIIGFIASNIIDSSSVSFLVPMLKCHISTIVVEKSRRMNGVGRQMVEFMANVAATLGASNLSLDVMGFNSSAYAFYEAMGFAVFSTKLTKPIE